MDASSTWPPPPDTPSPLAAHDGFLTACVLNSSAKRPVSRLRLVIKLRKEQGIDVRQCRAIVNDYCDRYLILMPARGFAAWGLSVMSLGNFVIIFVFQASLWLLKRNHDRVVTRMERVAITNEMINVSLVSMIVTVALGCVCVAFALRITKKRRRDAEDARKKLAG